MVGHPPAGNETNTQDHRKHLPALRPHRKPLSEVVHGCHLWMRHNPSRRRPPTTPRDRVRFSKLAAELVDQRIIKALLRRSLLFFNANP